MMEDWVERDQAQPQPVTNGTEWEMVDAVAVYEPPSATARHTSARTRANG